MSHGINYLLGNKLRDYPLRSSDISKLCSEKLIWTEIDVVWILSSGKLVYKVP